MKYTGKRLLSLLLAVLLALGALPAGALAAEEESGYSVMLESLDGLGGEEDPGFSTERSFGAPSKGYDMGDMYSQLSTRQKACYDALEKVTVDRLLAAAPVEYKGRTYRRLTLHVPGMDGVTVSGQIVGGQFIPSAASKKMESGIYTDLYAAIVSLRYDRPDILWIGYMRYGYKVSQTGGAIKITGITLDFHLEYDGREKTMQEEMLKTAESIAAEAAKTADTFQKVKMVHDLLAERNSYGDPAEWLSHSAYSALAPGGGGKPVCDGYSKAFKVVCGILGIPCAMPSSNDHMWNNVKMDDGNWYNVDLTWDDDGEQVEYDYFLVGSQTKIGEEIFSQQPYHVEKNPYDDYREDDKSGMLQPVTLRFPTKSREAYEYRGQDYPALTFPDVKRNSWYYEAVENSAQLGLFTGDTNGLFLPDKNITRAEFALVTAKAMGVDLTEYTESSFTDVPAGKWYTGAAAWAKATGLMAGYKDGSFHPGAPITRQEMCVVLSNAIRDTVTTDGVLFPDDGKIAAWAKSSVYRCRALGLVQGDEKGYFSPRSNTQRSAAAVVFVKFAALEKPGPVTPTPETEKPETKEPETQA